MNLLAKQPLALPDNGTVQHHRRAQRNQRGLSLIELMIAMSLGVLVIGGTITVFSGALRSSELNQSLSNLQANARFALDSVTRDVRMAGFQGCASSESAELRTNAANPPTTSLSDTAVTGYVVNASNWSPTKPTGYTPPTGAGAPVVGTHALSVQYAALPGHPLRAGMANGAQSIPVNGPVNDLFVNEFAVIADCNSAELFKVSSISGATGSVTISAGASLDKGYSFNSNARENSRVMPFVTALYYIGDTGRQNASGDAVRSLYLQTFPFTPASNPPIEMVEGVDQLQLSFGVWQDGSNDVAFVAPDTSGLDTTDISMVRVGLLMTSVKRFANALSGQQHYLAGQKVIEASKTAATGSITYPADARLRVPFNATIKVRNRHVENRT